MVKTHYSHYKKTAAIIFLWIQILHTLLSPEIRFHLLAYFMFVLISSRHCNSEYYSASIYLDVSEIRFRDHGGQSCVELSPEPYGGFNVTVALGNTGDIIVWYISSWPTWTISCLRILMMEARYWSMIAAYASVSALDTLSWHSRTSKKWVLSQKMINLTKPQTYCRAGPLWLATSSCKPCIDIWTRSSWGVSLSCPPAPPREMCSRNCHELPPLQRSIIIILEISLNLVHLYWCPCRRRQWPTCPCPPWPGWGHRSGWTSPCWAWSPSQRAERISLS